jgi:hypothetical protein
MKALLYGGDITPKEYIDIVEPNSFIEKLTKEYTNN